MSGPDLDLLVHRWFEREIPPGEEDQLWDRVAADPRAADRFVELAELESGLLEAMKAHVEAPPAIRLPGRTSRRALRFPRERSRAPLAAAAAVLFAALLLAVVSIQKRPAPAERAPSARVEAPTADPEAALLEEARRQAREEMARRQARLAELAREQERLQKAREEAPLPEARRSVDESLRKIEVERKEESAKLEKAREAVERPAPPTAVAAPPVATVERVEGEASRAAGESLAAGSALETRAGARAVVRFPDQSTLELGPETEIARLDDARGKTLLLARGTLTARVARQAAGKPMVVTTPHAETQVLGTIFVLQVSKDATRVEVREGRVRVRRLPDGPSIEVGAGHFAVAARGAPLAAKPIVKTRSFQDGADYSGTRDTSISMREPAANFGTREGLLVHRANDTQHTALLRWDLSSLPPGSRVLSAEITLFVTGGIATPGYRAYEVRRPWQELEATWRVFAAGQAWQTPGAQADLDRGSRVVAALTPSTTGLYTFPLNEAGLALVQAWIHAPAENRGIAIGGGSALQNAWEFDSRDSAVPGRRPKIAVTYIPAAR